jgi:Bacterial Ig-like domain (group 3)
MKFFARSLALATLMFLLTTSIAFAQKNNSGTRQDDSAVGTLSKTNAPRASSKKGGEEAEGDDAKARMLATQRQYGIATKEFKQSSMRARAQRKARENRGRAGAKGQSGVSTFSLSSPSSAGPVWVPIGPTGANYESNGSFSGHVRDSGRARKFLPHPTDPDTLFFLTSGGGLWVTHNFTAANTTWTPLTDDLPTTSGGSMAFGRTPDVIYLGTGDPFDEINIGGSMVKTTDGGQTWSPAFDLGAALGVRDVLVDMSGADDVIIAATDDGLYRSGDSGATYARILGGPGQLFEGRVFWTVVKTSAGLIANGQTCAGSAATTRPGASCGTQSTMYVSTDLGLTWAPVPDTAIGFTGTGRTTLAVAAPGDSVVYAFAENTASTDQKDLFRSTDGGLNWTALNINPKVPTNPNSDNPNMDLMHGQAFYNQMILVDPRDPARNTVYLGGNLSSAKTSDGGVTWTLLSTWLYDVDGAPNHNLPYVHADFHTAAISTAGATPTLMFGNDGGIFVSKDEGVSWTSDKNNGLQTHLLYTIASTPGFPNSVFGGFQDNGTRVREGDTGIYNQSVGGDGISATYSQNNGNLAVTTLPNNSNRFQLQNQTPEVTERWLSISVPAAIANLFFTPVTIPDLTASPTGKIYYTASAGRVNKVDFSGALPAVSIVATSGAGGVPAGVTFRPGPRGIGVSPLDLQHIGVPASGGRVVLTSNGGTSWTAVSINTLVPGFQSFMQSVTYGDNSTIFATSVAPLAGAVRVARSNDGGVSWTRADSGLPDVQIEKIYFDPSDPTRQTVLAATYDGVYRSTDQGATWASYGTGLPNVFVRDIYMPPDGSFIRVATYGRGFWELPMLGFTSATLTDDVNSCDHNGSLDNGETGTMTITLKNGGAASLSGISATVTSTNPAVSFPDGNVVAFAPAAAHSSTTSSLHVALNGAAGIQQLDFKIAYSDPSLGLPAPSTALASFRGNVDILPNGSSNDNFEANDGTWTVGGTPENLPDILNWRYLTISPIEHRWEEVDSNSTSDQTLTSPPMSVGAGNFTFAFEHRFRFENGGGLFFDGMVLEISTDNGGSWTDIGALATPTYNTTLFAGGSALSGRPAYGGNSAGWPQFVPVSVNLGTTYAGQTVRIRFRVASDIDGFAPGVEVRNITTSGLASNPFTLVQAHSGVCGTSMSLSSSANPSSFGSSVTFTASITGGVTTATGNVDFSDGASPLGSGALDSSGQAQFSTSTLSVGSHTINASYAGDGGHAASTSQLTQVVNQASTSTSVQSSLNPSDHGQSVTFTATISSTGNPTGTVSFFDGVNLLGSGAVSAGSATFTTSALADGTHSITATYNGDTNFTGSTSSALSQVVRAPSTTTIASSMASSTYGQSVTFTATVTSGLGTPAGSVSFFDGATLIGTASLNGSGQAALSISTLGVGSHSIKATYAGNGQFIGSTSGTVALTVARANTTVTVSSSPNPSLVGQNVTITATVASSTGAIPTGTVTFRRNLFTTLGTATIDATGHATLVTNALPAGSSLLSTSYNPSANFNQSFSTFITQTVNKNPSATALASSVNPSAFKQTVTFTATVTSGAPGTATGTVSFLDGSKNLGTVSLNGSGQASVAVPNLSKGSHSVTAQYSGDAARLGSASPVLTQQVN